jgi:hypothetical protein
MALRRSERIREKQQRIQENKSPTPVRPRRTYTRRKRKPKFKLEMVYNRKKKCYTVRNKSKGRRQSKKVYAYCTSKEKGRKQMRFLYALLNNAKFRKTVQNRRS